MNEHIKKFIKDNKDLIGQHRWDAIYKKGIRTGFTETLLKCGVNPLEQGLNYIPKNFLAHSNIKEFIIPDNVTSIGEYAFSYCTSLITVTIGDNVTSIGNNAFLGCSSLTSVTIPNKVTIVDELAFADCYSLKNITIPSSVTSIGNSAFYNCSLTSIKYIGTKKEAMKLGIGNRSRTKWRIASAIEKIICTDGVIEL